MGIYTLWGLHVLWVLSNCKPKGVDLRRNRRFILSKCRIFLLLIFLDLWSCLFLPLLSGYFCYWKYQIKSLDFYLDWRPYMEESSVHNFMPLISFDWSPSYNTLLDLIPNPWLILPLIFRYSFLFRLNSSMSLFHCLRIVSVHKE